MDWICRILLSLFAVNLIVNAKYFPIWDDLALVTLILQASIITFGTLPFLIKILNALMMAGLIPRRVCGVFGARLNIWGFSISRPA